MPSTFHIRLTGCSVLRCAVRSMVLVAVLGPLPLCADVQPPTPAARVDTLIQQLGHDQYVLREQASAQLQGMGAQALDALTEALADDDIEVVMRARYLLSAIEIPWTSETDSPRIRGLFKDYEQKTESDRESVMQNLHQMRDAAAVGSLCQIVRYDKSHLLSKRAALLVINLASREPSLAVAWADRVKTTLATSKRSGVAWIMTYLDCQHASKEIVARWKPLVEKEQALSRASSSRTRYDVVQKMLMHYVDFLEADGRGSETEPYLQQIADLQPGDDESLKNLIRELLERDAYRVLVTVAKKHSRLFDADPILLYSLAHAQRELGNAQASQTAVAKARAMNPTIPGNRLVVADTLRERGWFDWAEPEFRIVIAAKDVAMASAVAATFLLSEMLHDQQHNKKAADVLQALVKEMHKNPVLTQSLNAKGRTAANIAANMNFLYAAHFAQEGDSKKQMMHLEKAIQGNAADVDVLIALYRLPGQNDARRQATRKQIDIAAQSLRTNIVKLDAMRGNQNPTQVSYAVALYSNNLAWLIANTVGETDAALGDEAIQAALRSVELDPNKAGSLDTLGRCYYAREKFEQAVKYQSEAVRRDPHSGQIRRQLDLFQKALDDSKAKP